MPHGLVSRCTPAAFQGERIRVPGQYGRDPVAVFHPGPGVFPDRLIGTQKVKDFGPEPFGGIDASLEFCIVHSPPVPGNFINLGSFPDRRVVFPEDEHGIRVFLEPGGEGKGGSLPVHGHGGGSGGIDR